MKKSWQHLQFIRSILVGKEVPDNAQVFRAERYFCEMFGSHTDSHCSFCCSYELTRWNFHEGNENGNVQERRQSKACVDLLIRAQGDKAECFNPLEINFFFIKTQAEGTQTGFLRLSGSSAVSTAHRFYAQEKQ